jgi:2-polyprenyl-3-methyl-5-hydroxy-6-metoxy-1,4-benzoquinol methylase
MENADYIIRGGVGGRERLRILARVMRSTTLHLLERAGMRRGMICLEVGCGGGELAFDMARLVGPEGRVLGTDIDPTKLELARREAAAQHLANLEFRLADITRNGLEDKFDLIHARFVLTHLRNPLDALVRMREALRPAGVMVVEDVDFQGYFCYPEWRSPAPVCGAVHANDGAPGLQRQHRTEPSHAARRCWIRGSSNERRATCGNHGRGKNDHSPYHGEHC